MKKIYLIVSSILAFTTAQSQCPTIDGAMIKPCINTAGEGINEFIFFTTTEAGTAGDYIMYYGSSNPPKTSSTAVLSGNNAAAKTGTGSVTASGGCTVNLVTSPATAIPANSRVMFIPNTLDQVYDVAGICKGGSVYVVFIDVSVSPSNKWMSNGTLANSAGAARYIQVTKGAENCTAGIRSYTSSWPTSDPGNAVSWNPDGVPTYFNNGCTNIITPVKLLSFNVTGWGNNANLAWKTSNEINTRQFEIERSTDGATFTGIATVAAAGQSSQVRPYVHTDINIPAGTNYYRLKMIDRDGSYSYSPVVKLISSRNRFIITNVYPKPTAGRLHITWNAPRAGNTQATVYDMAGRLLINQLLPTIVGMNNSILEMGNLPKGNYQLRLEKDGSVQTMSFTKQ